MLLYIKKEYYFLSLIAYGKNNDQIVQIIKKSNTKQYRIFQLIARDILRGKVSLSKKQFTKLKKVQNFIRKLSKGLISKLSLIRNLKVLKEILNIILKSYEICGQICSYSCGEMEYINKKKPRSDATNKPNEKYSKKRKLSRTISESSSSTFLSNSSSTSEYEEEEEEEQNTNQTESNESFYSD